MTDEATPVLLEKDGHVAEIILNRPERMNAITPELITGMEAALERACADAQVRAVVLRGEGRAFCAGLDKSNFARMAQPGAGLGDLTVRDRGDANLFQHAAMMWRRAPIPVIAAMHGVALGGGLQIALGADMRVAAPDLRVSVMEMKWGIVPDMGGMALMRRLARGDVIRRLTYTAEMIDAAKALEFGLVTEIADDPLARARQLAATVAAQSPAAIRAAKRLLNLVEEDREAEILMAESRIQMEIIGGPEQLECVRAGLEGRPPRFD
ncbi:crotonase/enoyl-CoA hydratase family protein [Oceanicella actignis]|uniref:Enoyl-CoA hydratase/carnithine racemase n=1 Tax=Oceanicella actignis TaxID=1189325 RepID=A0A1M7THE8_9RHOB|nr:crotonase/enoyl-CoA hydratase family protein [Oceanicella actignis]TYO88468.1 enoyl-CoA hydratase/carnithine racemase [Oceanicella actignis]SET59241.1 Enoyl-CoA hydratase/carnithine racemase [Oceanicella actignis]SHN70063.1 Enoyl-CoA hydratase/carnithine racemase [Oceanicella actignis]